jgi:hypothetical protein
MIPNFIEMQTFGTLNAAVFAVPVTTIVSNQFGPECLLLVYIGSLIDVGVSSIAGLKSRR